ncbi:MAG: YidC/Oxa1 family membrane protein insertase [Candidatus Peribacteraceae bacterium]|nr:YidC/Oxa1 family membrane protein insertase [Candidatus Peribacteraceae bacterium]
MAEPQKRSSIFQFLLLFLTLYIGMNFIMGQFFPSKTPQQMVSGPELTASSSFTLGNHPVVTLTNKAASEQSFGITGWIASKWCAAHRFFTVSSETGKCTAKAVVYSGTPYTLANRCPNPPFDIFVVEKPGEADEKLTPVQSGETVIACESVPVLEPGEIASISLAPWKYSIFEKPGTYEVRLPGATVTPPKATGTGTISVPKNVARFSLVEPGIFRKTFRTFISAPFLNFLVFVASMTPGYNLGVAIILLTLAVKILLFFPTQHALEGQKKMQMLQPKLEALKAKYKGDAKKIQEETMNLWKEHKINPFQSILPMLLQFPVLIGLFYVIRDASDVALSQHLLYGFNQDLSWQFGTGFLGLDLLEPNWLIMPVLLMALQFFQMKLSFSIQKRKKNKQDSSSGPEKVIDVDEKGNPKKAEMSSQDMQQKMMLYGLPFMIGFFALQFPAAVALYWGVSTVFAIGQQVIVNREHLRV